MSFLAFLGLNGIVTSLFEGQAGPWPVSEPQFWVFPLQTVVCGGLLAWGWRFYGMRWPAGWSWAIGIGSLVFLLWISPQLWLGFAPRRDGFDPTFFGHSGWAFGTTVFLRFVRLVIVVPLLEEIFWRGFLLRYLIREQFLEVPFGTYSRLSFLVTTIGFCLEHQRADWPAAFVTGVLYNLVAYRTRSLSACVVAHALTNLLLGLYVMRTGQWGFW